MRIWKRQKFKWSLATPPPLIALFLDKYTFSYNVKMSIKYITSDINICYIYPTYFTNIYYGFFWNLYIYKNIYIYTYGIIMYDCWFQKFTILDVVA